METIKTQLEPSPPAANRWWIYQAERFPILAHGPLILAFSFSGVSYSALLRAAPAWPDSRSLLVAFVTSFCFFLQLRIADEFKDFEEDSRFRPYRPVPRGLVRLSELGWVGLTAAIIQAFLAWLLEPRLLILLLLTWSYLALMSKEFFARAWLKARPFTYLWTHMLIMPLIDFYATGCDWFPKQTSPPSGLFWFLIVSFFNGVVIEIGRKIRVPADEERGVETYTFLWGRRNAILAWWTALLATAFCALMAARRLQFFVPALCLLSPCLLWAFASGAAFLRNPAGNLGRRIETISGLWTLLMYLSLGAFPLFWKLYGIPLLSR